MSRFSLFRFPHLIYPLSIPKAPLKSMSHSLPGARHIHDDLTTKKCVPCNSSELQPMTKEIAETLITNPEVHEWNLVNEGGLLKLKKSWRVKSFVKGLEFFKLVAQVAEAEGHHPDLHLVQWNNVAIDIWTHAVGGLTENDFILAAKINKIQCHDLIRRKARS